MWYKNITGRFFGLITKHACDRQMDRQTDRWTTDGRTTVRQNYNSQDLASIAVSHGKKANSSKNYYIHLMAFFLGQPG